MATYNHGKFLKESIDSVLNQTFQDFDFIITNDGSIDNTKDILGEYANNNKIKIFSFEKNQGALLATENCIKNITGKYVAIINSDDVWNVDKLEKQVLFLDNNIDIFAVFTKVNIINEKSKPIKHYLSSVFNDQQNRTRYEWLRYFFYKGNAICHPSILVRKECYDIFGSYKYTLSSLPDFDMWIKICSKFEIYLMEEKLISFRILDNEMNESGNRPENIIRTLNDYYFVMQNFLNLTVDDFLKTFPDIEKFDNPKLLPYYFAIECINQNNISIKAFGLHTLYTIMDNKEIRGLLLGIFELKDLYKISRNINIYNPFFNKKYIFLYKIINKMPLLKKIIKSFLNIAK